MRTYLDFEKPIAELESKVAELRMLSDSESSVPITDEITRLQQKAQQLMVVDHVEVLRNASAVACVPRDGGDV